jgi:pheromone a factor receptor
VSKATKIVLRANTEANARAQRTKRRLYQMALSIIVPYVPLQMVFFIINMRETLLMLEPYDYYSLHVDTNPYPWSAIIMIPSWMLDFASMNQPWVPILTVIPIVLFFGMTNEAIDMYRKCLLWVGFSRCFPSFKETYDSNRTRDTSTSRKSLWSLGKSKKPLVNEL